jgi:hypothetical protein
MESDFIVGAGKRFDECVCIKSNSDIFKPGFIYPICGWNNGIHIIGETSNGDPYDLVCHNFGDMISTDPYGSIAFPLTTNAYWLSDEYKADDCLDKEIIKYLSNANHDLLEYIRLLREDNKMLLEQLKQNEMEMQNTWKNLTKK